MRMAFVRIVRHMLENRATYQHVPRTMYLQTSLGFKTKVCLLFGLHQKMPVYGVGLSSHSRPPRLTLDKACRQSVSGLPQHPTEHEPKSLSVPIQDWTRRNYQYRVRRCEFFHLFGIKLCFGHRLGWIGLISIPLHVFAVIASLWYSAS